MKDKPEWHNVHGIKNHELYGHNTDVMTKYGDIIDLQHPDSLKHKRMSLYNRAAQFAPFAALTGYEEAIEETGRQVSEKMILSESQKELLDRQLQELKDHLSEQELCITWFKKDEKKAGGEYVTTKGYVKKIDILERKILMEDGQILKMDDIYEIGW
ncbi:YolD-like family protein [Oribacterium sp. P6A1]|uniref:YolD-like family protein n=1 Tax=Oribacterium sp. P6A1 TaxID=1410612 RepID=UPI000B30C083|nr:YolD-like family protein [Oribacterium sp. P6A1]